MEKVRHDSYFEGVLQLRNPTQEILDFIKNQVLKSGTVKIARAVNQKNGVDYYMSSMKFLRQLARKLPTSFAGQLKSTRKLFTRKRQTSKNVYRVNIMFRMPSFKKGNVVTIRGTKMKVITIGNRVLLQNVETGKKKHVGFDEVEAST